MIKHLFNSLLRYATPIFYVLLSKLGFLFTQSFLFCKNNIRWSFWKQRCLGKSVHLQGAKKYMADLFDQVGQGRFAILKDGISLVKAFLQRIFKQKKIVIISEKRIISIPLSTRIQSTATLLVIASLIWVSYSSGKFFSYEKVLSSKEQEILDKSYANKNLLYQVADLQNNLQQLNTYFQKMNSQAVAIGKKTGKPVPQLKSSLTEERIISYDTPEPDKTPPAPKNGQVSSLQQKANKVLNDIHQGILQRIESIEHAISLSGLDLTSFTSKKSPREKMSNNSTNQGGPFVFLENEDHIPNEDISDYISYLMDLEEVVTKVPLAKPIANARVTSSFGRRKDPVRKVWAFHQGIDLAGSYRTPIKATANGRVKRASRKGAYGLFVEIDHGNNLTTRYGHLSKILVKKGDRVVQGQSIGLQGNTGRSTGSHLHYEVLVRGKAQDPSKFLKAGRYVY